MSLLRLLFGRRPHRTPLGEFLLGLSPPHIERRARALPQELRAPSTISLMVLWRVGSLAQNVSEAVQAFDRTIGRPGQRSFPFDAVAYEAALFTHFTLFAAHEATSRRQTGPEAFYDDEDDFDESEAEVDDLADDANDEGESDPPDPYRGRLELAAGSSAALLGKLTPFGLSDSYFMTRCKLYSMPSASVNHFDVFRDRLGRVIEGGSPRAATSGDITLDLSLMMAIMASTQAYCVHMLPAVVESVRRVQEHAAEL